ncbi:CHASE2 domain-containing protein [Trichocoleus sp. FACHB-262]|uniref:CHASE2 domain-containing protein n=1 Tax=Trichocoleus sp. FACHB-262 TaxID=2692869 RepID=UPI00168626E3|nr:CHASE2 domain-containing protein [Trichocoleus sp. FACHB-262]MBD2121874.1 CHASE2 domain-containing protein [Trichocoleus sp. FACHB-262]
MSKSIVLNFGSGDLQHGFSQIQVEVREPYHPAPIKLRASLPAAPDLVELYRRWQMFYREYYQQFRQRSQQLAIVIDPDLDVDEADLTNFSEIDFEELRQRLPERLNDWLDSEGFRATERQLRTLLDPQEEIQITIETEDDQVRQLPWCLWSFLDDYVNAEIELSNLEYCPSLKTAAETNKGVRILVLLGNSEGIDVTPDQKVIAQLAGAKPKFLTEPSAEAVSDRLWKQSWDILFFAGHSSSREEEGCFYLNQTEKLTIDDLRPALRTAIANGLKLAIFNSCDGSKLATELADLHIPAIIVMREPIPDAIAHRFLKYFLESFSTGASLHKAFRDAREKLRVQQRRFPCADWLPMLFRNPTEPAPTWVQLLNHSQRSSRTKSKQPRYWQVLMIALLVTALMQKIRQFHFFQPLELASLDQMMRIRLEKEQPDKRLFVIQVTPESLKELKKEPTGFLDGDEVADILRKLTQNKPQVIGLDIYRDKEQYLSPKLKQQLQKIPNLIGICKVPDEDEPRSIGNRPPPGIPIERIGFSDFAPLDVDQVLRRHLFEMQVDEPKFCETQISFATQIALAYFRAKKVPLDINKKPWKFRNVTVQAMTGGYPQSVDLGGMQGMIRYRSYDKLEDIAPSVSLKDFLNDDFEPNEVQGRIVLIGYNVPGEDSDRLLTPYPLKHNGGERRTPGVFIHAQIISQLLSAVMDKRPLIWWWPRWGEAIWIACWALLGGAIAVSSKSIHQTVVLSVCSVGMLWLICWIVSLEAGWIPFVPVALALLATSGSVMLIAQLVTISVPSKSN